MTWNKSIRVLISPYFSLIIILMLGSTSCSDDPKREVKELPKSKYADIIRNPLSASGNVDTTDVAHIKFDEVLFNFDTIQEGDVIDHSFHFVNDGKKPLSITETRSTCGCTIADYPKKIMDPGVRGSISVSFNSEGKTGHQDKPISVYANTLPQKSVVRLRGYVIPKKLN